MELQCFKNINPEQSGNYQDCKNNECYFCKCHDNLNDSFYAEKIITVCFLCNMIISNKKNYINMCLLCYSENLTQQDIINKTRKYYNKHGTIPFPQQLDPDVKMINIPVYIFSQFENKKSFDHFLVFFTSHIQNHMENEIKNAFSVSKKKEPLSKYYECVDYEFTDEQLESAEQEKSKIQKNNFSCMIDAENLLNKKYSLVI
jgi:hypothetical protein